LETLEGDGDDQNPDCLTCHTVGQGETGGFVDRATTNGLAGVQCESCHGPGLDHVSSPHDPSRRPPKDIAGNVCGRCHIGCGCHRDTTYPTFQRWSESKHGGVDDNVAEYFANGQLLTVCGVCHSGDYRLEAVIGDAAPGDELLVGKTAGEMNGVACVICHDPHSRTGHAANPDPGWDYQLRYRQVADPTPSNSAHDSSDPDRFNLCGQCHRGRGRTWQSTDRGPHHSVQSNVYVGEMPMPEGQEDDPLAASVRSVHASADEQCCTCHMFRNDTDGGPIPSAGGHTFEGSTEGCSAADCHASPDAALAAMTSLQNEVQAGLDDIAARLGDPNAWEYAAAGGADEAGQSALSDEIKKARFLYHYVISDGSLGVHNPQYVRSMLRKADRLLASIRR